LSQAVEAEATVVAEARIVDSVEVRSNGVRREVW
jgi:hypothetical protein